MLLYFQRSLKLTALASFGGCLLLAAAHPAAAQYATLSLQSQPGDFIGQGQNKNITYTSFGPNAAQVRNTEPSGVPGEILFVLGDVTSSNSTNTFALLFFGTNQLGLPLQPGTYTDAQRADFAALGHAGLDVSFQNRGSNTLTGSFTVTDFTYSGTAQSDFVIDTFDATFEQHSEGAKPALFGQFSYRDTGSPPAAVPEASTTVSFGLLLALGMGGVVIAAKRRKVAVS